METHLDSIHCTASRVSHAPGESAASSAVLVLCFLFFCGLGEGEVWVVVIVYHAFSLFISDQSRRLARVKAIVAGNKIRIGGKEEIEELGRTWNSARRIVYKSPNPARGCPLLMTHLPQGTRIKMKFKNAGQLVHCKTLNS